MVSTASMEDDKKAGRQNDQFNHGDRDSLVSNDRTTVQRYPRSENDTVTLSDFNEVVNSFE